jgi:hypothetical protein
MLEFNARSFTHLMMSLATLIQLCEANVDRTFTDSQRKDVDGQLNDILSYCKKLGLSLSALALKRMITVRALKTNDVSLQLHEAQQRIFDELKAEVFFHVGKEKSQYYYSARKLFGKEILLRFPSIVSEVEEAGKCYAFGRNTACVFHLMRVMEAGLKAVARSLNIEPSVNRSWDAMLRKFDEQIKNEHDMTDFYNGLKARLYAVKDAWRNPTMHIEKIYGSDEALDIMQNVNSFMRYISAKLKE